MPSFLVWLNTIQILWYWLMKFPIKRCYLFIDCSYSNVNPLACVIDEESVFYGNSCREIHWQCYESSICWIVFLVLRKYVGAYYIYFILYNNTLDCFNLRDHVRMVVLHIVISLFHCMIVWNHVVHHVVSCDIMWYSVVQFNVSRRCWHMIQLTPNR